jgi:tetratricopeptide (TPR) repeat protein
VIDHFLQTAYAGAKLSELHLVPFTLASPRPGVTAGELASPADADEWFSVQYSSLLAAVALASEAGLTTATWQLAWALTSFQLRRGYWLDHTRTQQTGLDAARSAADPVGEAHARLALAIGFSRAGRFDDAGPLFDQSQRLLEAAGGHHASKALVHCGLSWLAEREERVTDALRHAQQAYALNRAAGSRLLQAMSLNDIGYFHAMLGHYQQAMNCCERALANIRESGEPVREAATWYSLGYIHRRLGDHRRAITCYERSLELCRRLGDRFNEADSLAAIGDVYDSVGDVAAARRVWTRALHIFHVIEHPDTDLIRAKLSGERGREISALPVIRASEDLVLERAS